MRFIKFSTLLFVLGTVPAWASSYQVTVDTTSLSAGTSGFLDLAFNGGYPATATVSRFSAPGATLDASSLLTSGTVSGVLPATVVLADDDADYDEGIKFGSSLTFNLSFADTAGGSTGDVFTLSFFNSALSGGLLTGNDVDFWLAQFQLDTTGAITATAYTNPTGGPSFATIAAVPEPATAALMMAGAGLCFLSRRRIFRHS